MTRRAGCRLPDNDSGSSCASVLQYRSGVGASVEKVDITREERIVTMCRRGSIRQQVEILKSGDGNTGTSQGGVDHRIPPFAHRFLVNAYQFYDFRTEDGPLTTAEIAELRAISARGNHIDKLHKPLQMGGFDQLTSKIRIAMPSRAELIRPSAAAFLWPSDLWRIA